MFKNLLASNVLQLMTNGVSLRDITKGMPEKLVEIDQHLRNVRRVVELKAELAEHTPSSVVARRIKAEIQSREDASKRMSIWPLIEAGEFSTISEGLTEQDAAIGQGRWAEKLKEIVDRAPAKLGTAGRYAVISRDTALFKGMSRAVQYGDFLAKAVLYDHMMKREKADQETALKKIEEEFVNYNLLPGRTRSYAESMGLTWFWAYKLRSLKIAHRHMRDNPLRALLMTQGTEMLPNIPMVDVGSPITDNILSVVADDRLGYSIVETPADVAAVSPGPKRPLIAAWPTSDKKSQMTALSPEHSDAARRLNGLNTPTAVAGLDGHSPDCEIVERGVLALCETQTAINHES